MGSKGSGLEDWGLWREDLREGCVVGNGIKNGKELCVGLFLYLFFLFPHFFFICIEVGFCDAEGIADVMEMKLDE